MLAVNMEIMPRIIWMGFVSYKNPWIHFRRSIDEYVLYIVKSGQMHIQENGVRYTLHKGHVFLLEPNLEHEGFERHPCDYYYIHFKHPDIEAQSIENMDSFAKGLLLEEQDQGENSECGRCILAKHFVLEDKAAFDQVQNSLQGLLHLYRRKHYNRSLIALKVSELFIRLSRANLLMELRNNKCNTKGIVKAHELLDYIHHNYPSKITGKEIESIFECNFDYMNRIFNQLTGSSIMRYLIKVRINHAQELLLATHLSISEIAFLVGFQDIYYFSKVFKKVVGLSPAAFYTSTRGAP